MSVKNLLLRVPFRDSLDAVISGGAPAGRVDPAGERVDLVDDDTRRGAYFGRSGCVHYAVAGNFRAEAGTVMMWFKPDWPADFQDELGRVLWDVRIEAGSVMPDDPSQRWALVYPNPSSGRPEETKHRWRFCVATNRNRYVIGTDRPREDRRTRQAVFGTRQAFEAGRWLHLAVAWSENEGAIFVNGREDRRDALPEGLPWRELPETMQVGAVASWINAGPCGVISDFRVYGSALSASAVASAMEEHDE